MTATTAWAEHIVDVAGHSWSYRSAGTGDPVLVLDPPGEPESLEVLDAFTAHRRLIVVATPAASGTAADVAGLLSALGVERCAVVARGTAAATALRLAAERSELVDTIILESPDGLDASLVDALPSIGAPTLVLLGQRTDAAGPTRTAVYKRLPGSTIGLVYDAGVDIRGDRTSAYLAAVSDYLERGQAFVVNTRSSVIND